MTRCPCVYCKDISYPCHNGTPALIKMDHHRCPDESDMPNDKLQAVMDRASAEVSAWPEWKGSTDVKAELAKLPQRKFVVSTTGKNGQTIGLYASECCGFGSCTKRPNHNGRHDQFGEPRDPDSIPFHPHHSESDNLLHDYATALNVSQLIGCIENASGMLFDAIPLDAEHDIIHHTAELAERYRMLCKAMEAAIAELAKPFPEIG